MRCCSSFDKLRMRIFIKPLTLSLSKGEGQHRTQAYRPSGFFGSVGSTPGPPMSPQGS
jgi:hypothetical protein